MNLGFVLKKRVSGETRCGLRSSFRLILLQMKIRKEDLNVRNIIVRLAEPVHQTAMVRVIPMTVAREYGQKIIVRDDYLQNLILGYKFPGPNFLNLSTFRERKGISGTE